MDLEKLTKHQIVLLTLLVSFVTSIATGIVTVSLMDQAPPGVTRVINQIVEHTVEKVVEPVAQGAAVVAAPAVTTKTVVVKDEDLMAQSIAAAQKAVVRIVVKGSDQLVVRGVIIDQTGTAITDRSAIEATGQTDFEAYLYSSEKVPLKIRAEKNTATSSILVLDLAVASSSGFAPIALADASKVKLGSSVIRIGGTGVDTVGSGIIARLPTKDVPFLQATVSSATPGSVILTLFGEVLGLSTGSSQGVGNDFYSIPQNLPAISSPQ